MFINSNIAEKQYRDHNFQVTSIWNGEDQNIVAIPLRSTQSFSCSLETLHPIFNWKNIWVAP